MLMITRLLTGSVLILLFTSQMVLADEFIMVVNNDNPVSTMSVGDTKKIYLGKKTTWAGGGKINFVTQKDQEVHGAFLKQVVKKTSSQFSTYWKKALFTGVGTPPPVLDDDNAVKGYVSTNKGGIGYINETALDNSVKKVTLK